MFSLLVDFFKMLSFFLVLLLLIFQAFPTWEWESVQELYVGFHFQPSIKETFISSSNGHLGFCSKENRGSVVFGRLKFRQYPTLTTPKKSLNETTEVHRKHALKDAMATTVVVEATVAAAHVPAEVVRLIGTSKSYHYLTKRDRNLATIKIQSAFRAHLDCRILSNEDTDGAGIVIRSMLGFCSPEYRNKQILIDNALEMVVQQLRGSRTRCSG